MIDLPRYTPITSLAATQEPSQLILVTSVFLTSVTQTSLGNRVW